MTDSKPCFPCHISPTIRTPDQHRLVKSSLGSSGKEAEQALSSHFVLVRFVVIDDMLIRFAWTEIGLAR